MKNSHADLGIDKDQFNLVVEILQAAMDARSIPFTAQNQLLAKLAPTATSLPIKNPSRADGTSTSSYFLHSKCR